MKKINIISLIIFSTISVLFAQKVDLDKHRFKVGGMYDLPADPLAAEYKTYNINYSSNSNTYYFPTSMLQEVEIQGWKKLPYGTTGHISITFETGALIIDKSEIKEREEIQKDKNGKETGRKKYYTVRFAYTMPVGYKIEDIEKKVLHREVGYNVNRSGTFASPEFTSYNSAYDYKNNNMRNLMEQFGRELVGQVVNSLSYSLTNNWGLRKYSPEDFFWLMDSKKHPEQDSMQLMAKFVQETFPKYSAEMSNKEFKELMAPFINYCLNLPNKYKADEKADKKLRYSAYYNMAKLSDYLDDPEGIEKWAAKITENDYDPNDGKGYMKDAKKLRERFTNAKMNTRHLTFDVNSFEPPKQ